jgi:hypothetical protein
LLERLGALAAALARRRALALVFGALASLGVAAALAALLARLGLLAHLRWLPLALWLAAIAGAGFLVRGVRRIRSWQGIAGLRATAAMVEDELALRRGAFVGLVDLAGSAPAGSSADLVTGAARRMAARLPPGGAEAWAPRRDAALTTLVRRRAVFAAAGLLLAAAALVYAGDAAATLVSPLRALRAALRPRVAIALSKDVVQPGESVTVSVETEAGAASAALYLRRTGEPWRSVRLTLDAAGRASYPLTDVRAATFVYAAFEGRTSDTLAVRVLEPLVLGDFAVTASFPAYLQRADEDVDPAAGPLALPVGTVLALHGRTNAPLARALLVAGADTTALHAATAGFDGRLVVRGNAVWQLVLRDPGGAGLPEPLPSLDIRAVADSAPTVAVPVPGADTTMPLDLRAAIVVDLHDDHGLGRAEILSWRISRLGVISDTTIDTIPGVDGADRLVQSQILDASSRGLLPGDTLRFFVRARDRAPVPHVGRSRDFALRLRSMAEMREAVRLGTDSLAQRAADLASDQSALARQTEDLAAQRNRAADRTQRPTEAQRPTSERASESSQPFEQTEQAQRVADQQQALLQRADSLHAELQRLMEAAEQAGLNDPQWREQLHNLEELLRQATTPELQRQLDALQRALQQLDARGVQDALRNLAQRQQELRQQLQRSAELFERAALEGSMQTFAANAEQLRQEQQQWADRAPGRQDSSAAAAEERQLAREADSLRQNIDQLEQRLQQRGDSAGRQAMDRSSQRMQGAQQNMQQAARSMQQGQRGEASRQGRQAAQQLQQTGQELRQTQQQMSQQWRQEVQQMLNQSTQEAVTLANEEQRLSRELRRGEGARDARGRQSAMEQGINQIMRRLQDAAGRNALVTPRLGAMMSQARDQIAQSRQALEGPSPSVDEAAERSGEAAQILSQAAVQMMRNSSDIGSSQSGSGYQEAMQRMAQMAGQQGQLNDELGGLLPSLGSGQDAMMQQLRQLAERQRQLANQMERLNQSGVPGNPQALADEARQLADRIEQARLDRGTLERQQRLFRRMLDAGRSLRNDDTPDEPERKSRTAENPGARAPTSTARAGTLRYQPPAWSDLRQLAPAERAMVLDYFRRLNAPLPSPNAVTP